MTPIMAVQSLAITAFLELSQQHPVLDVRSPAEYAHAHIPGARSLPLFTDEERKVVGTLYKQKSREEAIKAGLDYFGGKMRPMVETVEDLFPKQAPGERTVLVRCWRGGMRSAGVAWLLDLYGFRVYTLQGGYKAWRRWALEQFERPWPLRILGGYTGSGKTEVLLRLQRQGQPVIDLEGLAHHKGSAFGNIGLPPQPGQEQFENKLAWSLWQVSRQHPGAPIWVEDESQRLGDVNLPIVFWKQMRDQPLWFLEIPFEARLQHIVQEYGALDRERVVNAILRIKKRLGGLETKEALLALVEDRVADSFRILLTYYDRWYRKGLQNREELASLLHTIACDRVHESNSQFLAHT
ncbi:MAG TPA: tRNA 2-selenouridine(34) synthase MnmH [Lacibacter sp.]|nr:tRNA 2-selenouridine(34) synthase MnmH [Lacibacter sp.]